MCRPLKNRDESLGSDKEIKYIVSIIRLLENPYSEYYSRGFLNSEGITLIMNMLRILSKYDISLSRLLKSCLKDRSYENVISKLSIIKERLGLNYEGESYENSIIGEDMF